MVSPFRALAVTYAYMVFGLDRETKAQTYPFQVVAEGWGGDKKIRFTRADLKRNLLSESDTKLSRGENEVDQRLFELFTNDIEKAGKNNYTASIRWIPCPSVPVTQTTSSELLRVIQASRHPNSILVIRPNWTFSLFGVGVCGGERLCCLKSEGKSVSILPPEYCAREIRDPAFQRFYEGFLHNRNQMTLVNLRTKHFYIKEAVSLPLLVIRCSIEKIENFSSSVSFKEALFEASRGKGVRVYIDQVGRWGMNRISLVESPIVGGSFVYDPKTKVVDPKSIYRVACWDESLKDRFVTERSLFGRSKTFIPRRPVALPVRTWMSQCFAMPPFIQTRDLPPFLAVKRQDSLYFDRNEMKEVACGTFFLWWKNTHMWLPINPRRTVVHNDKVAACIAMLLSTPEERNRDPNIGTRRFMAPGLERIPERLARKSLRELIKTFIFSYDEWHNVHYFSNQTTIIPGKKNRSLFLSLLSKKWKDGLDKIPIAQGDFKGGLKQIENVYKLNGFDNHRLLRLGRILQRYTIKKSSKATFFLRLVFIFGMMKDLEKESYAWTIDTLLRLIKMTIIKYFRFSSEDENPLSKAILLRPPPFSMYIFKRLSDIYEIEDTDLDNPIDDSDPEPSWYTQRYVKLKDSLIEIILGGKERAPLGTVILLLPPGGKRRLPAWAEKDKQLFESQGITYYQVETAYFDYLLKNDCYTKEGTQVFTDPFGTELLSDGEHEHEYDVQTDFGGGIGIIEDTHDLHGEIRGRFFARGGIDNISCQLGKTLGVDTFIMTASQFPAEINFTEINDFRSRVGLYKELRWTGPEEDLE